mmetsp:Transcript_24107/g.47331  ORF Transcript_24107/g.47331 Transcript_24107/m.47331 type:complete len:89 (-) Transcript_24107:257-523(-)
MMRKLSEDSSMYTATIRVAAVTPCFLDSWNLETKSPLERRDRMAKETVAAKVDKVMRVSRYTIAGLPSSPEKFGHWRKSANWHNMTME